MHKKHHEKFKILDILAVTTQAREGIETLISENTDFPSNVTTQAREGIETRLDGLCKLLSPVTTQAREGIETSGTTAFLKIAAVTTQAREGIETIKIIWKRAMWRGNNSSPRGH